MTPDIHSIEQPGKILRPLDEFKLPKALTEELFLKLAPGGMAKRLVEKWPIGTQARIRSGAPYRVTVAGTKVVVAGYRANGTLSCEIVVPNPLTVRRFRELMEQKGVDWKLLPPHMPVGFAAEIDPLWLAREEDAHL